MVGCLMMKNNLPFIGSDTRKVCIICEGNEEYGYLERLKELAVWSEHYTFELKNAEGNGNVPARYAAEYQSASYDVVLVFCDTDKKPYEQYEDIKRKINDVHGVEGAADEVVIFGNPCTMQIIIEHWEDIRLTTQSKKANAFLIEKFTGIQNYRAHKDQIETLVAFITEENYNEMRLRLEGFPTDDKIVSSTNILKFIKHFEKEEDSWIDDINSVVESAV